MEHAETITIGETVITAGDRFQDTMSNMECVFVQPEFDDNGQLYLLFNPVVDTAERVRVTPIAFLDRFSPISASA